MAQGDPIHAEGIFRLRPFKPQTATSLSVRLPPLPVSRSFVGTPFLVGVTMAGLDPWRRTLAFPVHARPFCLLRLSVPSFRRDEMQCFATPFPFQMFTAETISTVRNAVSARPWGVIGVGLVTVGLSLSFLLQWFWHDQSEGVKEVKETDEVGEVGEEQGTPQELAEARLSTEGPVVNATSEGGAISEMFLVGNGVACARRGLVRNLGAGDSMLMLNVLDEPFASSAFELVLQEVNWEEMEHRGGLVPRRISIQGTIENGAEPLYRHPADEQPPLVSWSPAVLRIKEEVERALHAEFNHALIQHYRGGKDFIGEHADKTLDIAKNSFIVNVSLGATRTMILRGKKFNGPFITQKRTEVSSVDQSPLIEAEKRATQRICMPNNSVFILGWETNRLWTHGIKQDKRTDTLKSAGEKLQNAERISITFRSVATFRTQRDGQVYGQGARTKLTCEELESSKDGEKVGWDLEESDEVVDEETEAIEMLQAFSAENRRGDFDWEKYYGRGFDVVNFKILNEA